MVLYHIELLIVAPRLFYKKNRYGGQHSLISMEQLQISTYPNFQGQGFMVTISPFSFDFK